MITPTLIYKLIGLYIYLQHKTELIIIIEGSKCSKYEGAKDEMIKLAENLIKGMLRVKFLESTSIYCDPILLMYYL